MEEKIEMAKKKEQEEIMELKERSKETPLVINLYRNNTLTLLYFSHAIIELNFSS